MDGRRRRRRALAVSLVLVSAVPVAGLKVETNHTLPVSQSHEDGDGAAAGVAVGGHTLPGRTATGHAAKAGHVSSAAPTAQERVKFHPRTARVAPARVVDQAGSPLRRLVLQLRRLLAQYRLTAFTSEIGESLRPMVAHAWVSAGYAVSWAYVTLDVIACGFEAHWRNPRPGRVALSVLRASVFQAVATMLLPAYFIHNVVHSTETALLHAGFGRSLEPPRFTPLNFPLRSFRYPRQLPPPRLVGLLAWLPTSVGIACIPLIPFLFDHPIETFLHKVLPLDGDEGLDGNQAAAAAATSAVPATDAAAATDFTDTPATATPAGTPASDAPDTPSTHATHAATLSTARMPGSSEEDSIESQAVSGGAAGGEADAVPPASVAALGTAAAAAEAVTRAAAAAVAAAVEAAAVEFRMVAVAAAEAAAGGVAGGDGSGGMGGSGVHVGNPGGGGAGVLEWAPSWRAAAHAWGEGRAAASGQGEAAAGQPVEVGAMG